MLGATSSWLTSAENRECAPWFERRRPKKRIVVEFAANAKR